MEDSVTKRSNSQIHSPWLGGKSRLRHRFLEWAWGCRLTGWYDKPMPESTISSSQELWIWLPGFNVHDVNFIQRCCEYLPDPLHPGARRQVTCLPWWGKYRTLQRTNTENSTQIFPEKKLRGHSPNIHIHVPVSDLYISTIDLPVLLQEICRPILGIYKSLKDTWMWKLRMRPRNSQKRNT